jgi:hypothetical protein
MDAPVLPPSSTAAISQLLVSFSPGLPTPGHATQTALACTELNPNGRANDGSQMMLAYLVASSVDHKYLKAGWAIYS